MVNLSFRTIQKELPLDGPIPLLYTVVFRLNVAAGEKSCGEKLNNTVVLLPNPVVHLFITSIKFNTLNLLF